MLLMHLGIYPEAADQFELIVQATPGLAEAHYGLAEAYLMQERWDAAVVQFNEVLRLRPGMPEAVAERERAQLLRDLRKPKQ